MNDMLGAGNTMNIVEIVIYLTAIGLSFWALQIVRFDVLLKKPKSGQAKILQLLLAIALGYGVGGFFMHYLSLSIRFSFFGF